MQGGAVKDDQSRQVGLTWFYGIREDINVIFYHNMPYLQTQYKSSERKISQKNNEYMLSHSLLCCYVAANKI